MEHSTLAGFIFFSRDFRRERKFKFAISVNLPTITNNDDYTVFW